MDYVPWLYNVIKSLKKKLNSKHRTESKAKDTETRNTDHTQIIHKMQFQSSFKLSYVNKFFDSESYWFHIEIKEVFSNPFCKHLDCTFLVVFFFSKKTHEECMKKFVALPVEERQLRINGKMMALTFFELYQCIWKN